MQKVSINHADLKVEYIGMVVCVLVAIDSQHKEVMGPLYGRLDGYMNNFMDDKTYVFVGGQRFEVAGDFIIEVYTN